jgi:hypothetical protein
MPSSKKHSALAPDHVAYSDETHHNTGRYRGIGLITLSLANAVHVNQQIELIIKGHRLAELKWGELRSAKSRHAASNLIDYLLEKALDNTLRIDVLTWDIEDSRHKIPGRDDIVNLRRMYYFIFKNVLSRRWSPKCCWKICVDENTQEPWSHLGELEEILEWDTGQIIGQLTLHEICEVKSHQEPLIQAADLFAGLGVYSRRAYKKFSLWRSEGMPTADRSVISNADEERFEVLGHFYSQCKKHKLGVSLNQKGGLRTFNPAKPINFWWYEPQGGYDKAPT